MTTTQGRYLTLAPRARIYLNLEYLCSCDWLHWRCAPGFFSRTWNLLLTRTTTEADVREEHRWHHSDDNGDDDDDNDEDADDDEADDEEDDDDDDDGVEARPVIVLIDDDDEDDDDDDDNEDQMWFVSWRGTSLRVTRELFYTVITSAGINGARRRPLRRGQEHTLRKRRRCHSLSENETPPTTDRNTRSTLFDQRPLFGRPARIGHWPNGRDLRQIRGRMLTEVLIDRKELCIIMLWPTGWLFMHQI